ncbi:hypothetical protein HS962_20835 [Pantoea sp. BIGb0393]|uniref:Uncharacterized protein n=1 Tax=Pantoea nemavictus TaxID=2726955 RepID=A0ABU8PY13_9GAMM|nr:hypothetical protein [Pantoea nemavictus]MBA0038657.1 hypothetical protein [Pantoea nemavictus]
MITSAAELHRFLLKNQNFDFHPEHSRDLDLYRKMKQRLDLPEGEFISALESRHVSAEAYLRALIAVAEPLSKMYTDIINYCERSNFLTASGEGLIQWQVETDSGNVDFTMEAFRHFEQLKTLMPGDYEQMRRVKNDVMDWMGHEVINKLSIDISDNNIDWSALELFSILKRANKIYGDEHYTIFKGLNNCYIGDRYHEKNGHIEEVVKNHPGYAELLTEVQTHFGHENILQIASGFVELPFWKFRWQVYEIWIIAISCQQLSRCGFQLKAAQDGRSPLALGKTATLATHPHSDYKLIYQPRYVNQDNDAIHPDLVLTTDENVTAQNSTLIIECKQRIELTDAHIDIVFNKYSAGVCPQHGQVVVVNYDGIDNHRHVNNSRQMLFTQVSPDTTETQAFEDFLQQTHLFKRHLNEVWYIDISHSMRHYFNGEFQDFVTEKADLSAEGGQVKIWTFAHEVMSYEGESYPGLIDMSGETDGVNNEVRGMERLCQHIISQQIHYPGSRIYIITDLVDDLGYMLRQQGIESDTVSIINPSK